MTKLRQIEVLQGQVKTIAVSCRDVGTAIKHALRIHLQMLDKRARKIQIQSILSNRGTKQLGFARRDKGSRAVAFAELAWRCAHDALEGAAE